MSWSLYRWVWRLESPVYVGATPAGSLNRCRLYVPARALWGAFTAELARRHVSVFPYYKAVGKDLQKNARFTYLYPAEQVGGGWRAWLPCYKIGKGLVWQREDQWDPDKFVTEREMRIRLLSTRPSTAIDPSSDTAAEGTLREMECINTRWRDLDGRVSTLVAMVGYVFIRNRANLQTGLMVTEIISLGGDTRYGLGRLRREGQLSPASQLFGRSVELESDDPLIESDTLLGHGQILKSIEIEILGQQETLAGWDYGSSVVIEVSTWAPGSRTSRSVRWRLVNEGCWVLHEGDCSNDRT